MKRVILVATAVVLLTGACGALRPTRSEPAILADAFFHGRAYFDANGNGTVDSGDPPLQGAYFNAADSRGIDSGGRTNSEGRAMAWFPGGGVTYPITLRMRAPNESEYVLLGPQEVVLQKGESATPDFLFTTLAPTATPE
jgi:hypothetical protein